MQELEIDDFSVYGIARDSTLRLERGIHYDDHDAPDGFTIELHINEVPLRRILSGHPGTDEMKTYLVARGGHRELARELDVLLLTHPSELTSGRVPLLACSFCGDFGCGGISTRISETSEYFVWHDFRHEADYDEFPVTSIEHIGPFRFQKEQYMAAIRAAIPSE